VSALPTPFRLAHELMMDLAIPTSIRLEGRRCDSLKNGVGVPKQRWGRGSLNI
jgi:hypothetical protein